jgi:hypothetical protein
MRTTNAAAIGFKLRFTGAAVPMPPPRRDNAVDDTDQSRSSVFQLGQFDLHLPSRVRARTRENVENQRCVRSITFLIEFGFAAAAAAPVRVRCRNSPHRVELRRGVQLSPVSFATAEKGRRIGLRTFLQYAQHYRRTGRIQQDRHNSSSD